MIQESLAPDRHIWSSQDGSEIIVDAPPRPKGTCKTCGVPENEIPWGYALKAQSYAT